MIDAPTYALLARLHGHLAMLGLALLLHPVITLRTRRALAPWTLRTAWLAVGLLAAPFALGWAIYPVYRQHPKVALWRAADAALWRFETKEHLAAFCVVLALAGTVTLHTTGRGAEGRRAAWALLAAAWGCGVIAGALGVHVASRAHPGW